ncbi:MAG TPA: cation diffusion facilitator family transporter [Aliidongia sp.]|uniref:cation diffusion facilitator family transporter n=2 Tax=Aliidongia sp. TaxID=1914230 RepID=UPI002DDC9218|nr:cation diffusion facilitator family transporter [Aliidongia sp.]HEV2676537.1 cation diffusion facilitator family transporter [Aliidongia sp.]
MASAKESVAFTSILASGLLTALKLAVGLLTGSLGILSEAAHSALDCAGTVLTFIAIRIGDKPPDHDHPYGHGKVESIAALAETALLFATSAWIIGAAAERLLHGGTAVEPSWTAVGVMGLSMVIDFFRSRKLTKVARETNSPALAADALHFRSDIYSSGVVLLGLGLVYLGYPLGDPLAAIGVAVFVLRAGYRLGRETIETLIDTAPEGIDTVVRGAIQGIADVSRIERVRGGPRGSSVFVDLDIAVARTLPLERVAEIKEQVTHRIQEEMPGADVMVMTHPLALDDETILDRVLVIAASQGVPVHHVTVQHVEERVSVSFDLEVDGRQSMAQAHVTASALERGIRQELGDEIEVESHIEPLQTDAVTGTELPWAEYRRIRDEIEALADATPLLIDAHEIRIRATEVGLYLSLHCHVPPDASVEDAHDAVSALEQKIRGQIDGVRRIIVHAEPPALPLATEPA